LADHINFAELDIDTDAMVSKQAMLIKQIGVLKQSQKELRDETGNLSKATDEQSKTYVSQDAELKKLNVEYNQQKAVLAEVQTGVKGLNDALNKQIKTEEDALNNNKQLRTARKKLNIDSKDYQKNLDIINAKIDNNNDFVEKNTDALTKQKMGIGNYTQGILNAVPGLGGFTKAQAAAKQGTDLFKISLYAIPLLAIVAGIAALVQSFASTQRGMDEINKVVMPMTALFQKFIGFLQDTALATFDNLKAAIDNPKQALKDLADVVLTNIMNRFKAFFVVIDAGKKLLKGDFSGAAKTAADAFIQFGSGIENGTDKIGNAAKSVSEFVSESVKQGGELDAIIKQIENRQIELEVPLAKARLEFEKLNEIAKDQSKSDQERIKALEAAEQQQRFIIASEKELTDLKIQRKKLENSFNDTSREDELELQKLISDGLNQEEAAQKKINSLTAQKSAIAKRQAQESVKILQDQLKKEEEQLAESLARREEKRQAQESAKILQDQLKKEKEEERLAESLARREELQNEFEIAKRYGQIIKFEEELLLLEEQGASEIAIKTAKLNQEEQLDIEATQRRIERGEASAKELELIERHYALAREDIRATAQKTELEGAKDVANQLAAIAEKQTFLGKAAALAQASINTYQGATKALATLPPPFGAISAGLTIVAGLKNVSKIARTQVPKYQKFAKGTNRVLGEGSETSDSVPTMLSINERVLTAKQNKMIGMDMSNEQLVNAAMLYKSFALNGLMSQGGSMSDKGIIKELQATKRAIKNKPTHRITITESRIDKSVNQEAYLS